MITVKYNHKKYERLLNKYKNGFYSSDIERNEDYLKLDEMLRIRKWLLLSGVYRNERL